MIVMLLMMIIIGAVDHVYEGMDAGTDIGNCCRVQW